MRRIGEPWNPSWSNGTGEGVKFHSLDDLQEWLRSHGISCESWGKKGTSTKSVDNLWDEISSGEAVMTESPARRRIAAVSVEIKVGGKTLVEARQRLANGAVRERNSPPAEKQLPRETADVTARRCLHEELGIRRCRIRLNKKSATAGNRSDAESPSYPGLTTDYLIWNVSAKVWFLRPKDFETEEATGSTHAAVLTHYWEWH